jgi:hypothetical protein
MQNAARHSAARHPGLRRAAIATLALGFLLCGGAQAQAVRKCNIEGRVVFQASPCPPERAEPAVAAKASGPEADTTAPKKKTLADILRERDGADARHRAPAREVQGDGANVLRSRMGAV